MLLDKLRRLGELARLVTGAADLRSRRAILGCYRDLGASLRSPTEMSVSMREGARTVACRLRHSDILTLGEVFAARIYGAALPLPSRPLIIDAGANVGLASVWFKAACPDARILAFEPDPGNAALARANLDPLGDCEVIEAALAEVSGTARFFVGDHAATHSLRDEGVGAGSFDVRTLALAEVMADRAEARIDLLKLDVEGAELQVLEGMGAWLSRTDRIIGELHEVHATRADLHAALTPSGFSLRFFALGEPDVVGFLASRRGR